MPLRVAEVLGDSGRDLTQQGAEESGELLVTDLRSVVEASVLILWESCKFFWKQEKPEC